MRRFLLWCACLSGVNYVYAQRECGSFQYQQNMAQSYPLLEDSRKAIENFISGQSLGQIAPSARTTEVKIITIPVVVHILYHYPGENISDEVVKSQIDALNRDFRRLNPDTTKIPQSFKSLSADCGIEFKLATVNSNGWATTGIIHKYTPITKWSADDKIKFSSEYGDDAWAADSYLNIWVGTLERLVGYASVPGDPANKDGIVIGNTAFGIRTSGIYDQGRTAVHEVGHWLGLRHLWGDASCGDDGISDTPTQQTFTTGCPTTVRISCNNAPNGDMYMDYMDFTNDDCLVMFTEGQKQRMRVLFEPGGPRSSILSSNGLGIPLVNEIPPTDEAPQWLHVQIYPNPAHTELNVNVEYDERWIGSQLEIVNISGQVLLRKTISSKIQRLDVSRLQTGIYFLRAEKKGEKMLQKFIKL